MEIRGHEIKFFRTTEAISKIAELCTDGDINNLGDLFATNNLSLGIQARAKILEYLQEGYEKNKAFFEDGYEPVFFKASDFMVLDEQTFADLFTECWTNSKGGETKVETEKPKKKVEGTR